MNSITRIALLGTGMSAAAFHDRLGQRDDCEIEVFDKSRGIGGRTTTRYTDSHQFDHGAQFFTARTPAFQDFLKQKGHVAPWTPNITTLSANQRPYKRLWYEPHFVATPRMNGVCKQVFEGRRVALGTEIVSVARRGSNYVLVAEDGVQFGPYDWVVSSAPAEQTSAIFSAVTQTPFEDVTFDPCFALMMPLSVNDRQPSFEAAVVKDNIVNWLALTNSKPGRSGAPSLVAHSNGTWASAHLEDDPSDVQREMTEAVISLADLEGTAGDGARLHRWRYARTTNPLGSPFWLDGKQRLGACGDWCLGDRVEDAYTSGFELATAVSSRL